MLGKTGSIKCLINIIKKIKVESSYLSVLLYLVTITKQLVTIIMFGNTY